MEFSKQTVFPWQKTQRWQWPTRNKQSSFLVCDLSYHTLGWFFTWVSCPANAEGAAQSEGHENDLMTICVFCFEKEILQTIQWQESTLYVKPGADLEQLAEGGENDDSI